MIRGEWSIGLQLRRPQRQKQFWVATVVILFAALRLCHAGLLWSDEDYHLSAALFMLHGKLPYRDFWYDKPPLNALYYLLIEAQPGVLLRLLDGVAVVLASYVVARIARTLWGRRESYLAPFLFAFYFAFYLPAAVIPFAADAVMVVPHVTAIYFALRGRPMWSGFCAGLAVLANNKGVFVLASCGVWLLPRLVPLVAGFGAPLVLAALTLIGTGAWPGYCEQVWRWSLLYAKEVPTLHPLRTGLRATSDWLGFHSAAFVPTLFTFVRESRERLKLVAWLSFSFAAVCLGGRFAPRYYLQVLPAFVVIASRGLVLAYETWGKRTYLVTGLLLAIPFLRFAPRYGQLAIDLVTHRQPSWSDVQMDLDSQQVAEHLRGLARPHDTLFVWGYRPDIYVFSRLVPDARFDDSQPLTGVPADRHLTVSQTIDPIHAAQNRREFTRSHPTYFVDGLGLLNPALSPARFPELKTWLADYKLVDQTGLSLIYKRR